MIRISARRFWAASLLQAAVIAAVPFPLFAQDTKATTQPASAPASKPTGPETKPAGPETIKVQKGDLTLEVRAEAPFQAIEPFEVKTEFKGYTGPLVIASIVAQGEAVRKDQSLITFDRTWYEWANTAAQNELAAAKANLAKAEIDTKLAEEADKLALRQAEDALKNVEAGKKWFEEVDGPQMLQLADLNVKQAQNSVDDQGDELDQLKKMYQGEELTAATADIVVRRAVRSLEQAKIILKIQQDRADKTKTFDYPVRRQGVIDMVTQTKSALDGLKAQQAQTAVARAGGLQAARIALEQATKKANDLKADGEYLQFRAPSDGVVAYGAMVDGVAGPVDPKNYEVGDKLPAGQVLLRVSQPSKLRLVVALPESQAFWVEKGDKARIVPAGLPQIGYTAETSAVEVQSKAAGLAFVTNIDLTGVDARLIPGMKASVVISADTVKDAVLIPLSSVTGGKVKVKVKEGEKVVEKEVKLGKTDGKQVQVLSGLAEGDEIVK